MVWQVQLSQTVGSKFNCCYPLNFSFHLYERRIIPHKFHVSYYAKKKESNYTPRKIGFYSSKNVRWHCHQFSNESIFWMTFIPMIWMIWECITSAMLWYWERHILGIYFFLHYSTFSSATSCMPHTLYCTQIIMYTMIWCDTPYYYTFSNFKSTYFSPFCCDHVW